MPARFDHLVIAVADLDEAITRWTGAGIPAVRGGAHPVGTENALVRGPGPAYLELIASGRRASNPWLDRVRSAAGPISWAIAVDDVDAAREALVTAGLTPQAVTEGSRRTPDGDTVAWRMCDVGPGPYDAGLPFLIEWTRPMPPGPAEGPVVRQVSLTPGDPDRVADLLLALGFVGELHWPRRVFRDDAGVSLTVLPVGEPATTVDWSMSWAGSPEDPTTSVALALPLPQVVQHRLDGVEATVVPDRRRYAAAALLPAVEAAFARLRAEVPDWSRPHRGGTSLRHGDDSRSLDPGRHRLLGARADAWIEAVTGAGLGSATGVAPADLSWAAEQHVHPTHPTRATVLRGRDGTLPVVVARQSLEGVRQATLVIGVGEPIHLLERLPQCACDGCDPGSAELVSLVDDAFVLALSGGVHVVRDADRLVTRTLDGWSSTGAFEPGEQARWLEDAAAGRRTDGVVRGEPWL